MAFLELDVATTEEELIDQAIDNLTTRFPGWVPNEAHLEVGQIEELSRIVHEAMLVASIVSAGIFRGFGRSLAGVPSVDGAPASLLATVTAIDDLGYTLPAGYTIAYEATGDTLWGFRTLEDHEIPVGETQVTNVAFESIELGTLYNDIPGATDFTLVDSLTWLDSIVSTTASSGGTDAETDDGYNDRLNEELTLLSPRPIKPPDFSVLAKRTAGVYRAVTIDGYNPVDLTEDNERMVAIAAVDEDGLAIGAGVKADLDDSMEAMREITFVVNVMDPTFTEIDIVFSAKAVADFDPATVEAEAEQRVKDFIDPANWGGGDQSPPVWELKTTLRYLEVAAVIENTPGLDYITTTGDFDLTINGARADVDLAGKAPLPKAVGVGAGDSSVDGTVTV